MQISSINNTNFGIKFSPKTEELFKQSTSNYDSYFSNELEKAKAEMNKMFDDKYTMGIRTCKSGDKMIVLSDKKGMVLPILVSAKMVQLTHSH